jgi:hypothetical protein
MNIFGARNLAGSAGHARRFNNKQKRESNCPLCVAALRQVWQDGAAMNESDNQFSFTRAASSTSGRAKNQFLIG